VVLIRGTSLTGFVELVDELGGNGRRLLEEHHIALDAVGDFDAFVARLQVLSVLEAAVPETGAIDFGRQLAARQGIEVLGSVGAAARTAPTVGKALATLERYLRAYNPSLQVRLELSGLGRVRLHLTRTVAGGSAYPQGGELAMGVAMQVFRLLIGRTWRPVEVDLEHQPLTSYFSYERYFDAPVSFGRPGMGFVLRASDLDRPLSTDASTHDVLVSHLQTITPFTPAGIVPMVNDLIRRLLPGGSVELTSVADELGLHPRTLQRRLEDEGVTFGELVQGVRRRTAENYLRDSDMSLRHLATELGYMEQSAFTRASRRWFGMSPLAYRRALRDEG
jgi:AraC-like DNA-binding protein